MAMKLLIYDCEIRRCIPNGCHFTGYEYCEGWRDFSNIGISVIGCYCYDFANFTNGLHSFTNIDNSIPAELPTFKQLLEKYPLVIGFNSKQFDDQLCQANNINIRTHYDLLEEIRLAAYASPDWEKQPEGHSYSLDSIAKASGMTKTGSGSLAPQLWQQGKRQEVVDYCLNDVKMTHDLLMLGQRGKLIDPNTKKLLKLRSPSE